eukprot:3688078-Rhodomonas_salina.1
MLSCRNHNLARICGMVSNPHRLSFFFTDVKTNSHASGIATSSSTVGGTRSEIRDACAAVSPSRPRRTSLPLKLYWQCMTLQMSWG